MDSSWMRDVSTVAMSMPSRLATEPRGVKRAPSGMPLSPRWPVKATARTRTEISEASARRMRLARPTPAVNSPLYPDAVASEELPWSGFRVYPGFLRHV